MRADAQLKVSMWQALERKKHAWNKTLLQSAPPEQVAMRQNWPGRLAKTLQVLATGRFSSSKTTVQVKSGYFSAAEQHV